MPGMRLNNGRFKYGAKSPQQADKMRQVMEVWLDNPLLTSREVAEKANVSRDTFNDYQQNDEWMAEYKAECDKRFESLRAAAVENLENALLDGDWRATTYVLDALGYQAAQKINVDANTTIKISIDEDENGTDNVAT